MKNNPKNMKDGLRKAEQNEQKQKNCAFLNFYVHNIMGIQYANTCKQAKKNKNEKQYKKFVYF